MRYEPILEIDTEDGPVYINSETDGEAEKWYEETSSFYQKYGIALYSEDTM